ncbi:MAG: hypothetical protein GTO63_13525 [Anaerolineae bacterium]|nr:hypothetical protein [Anaerolineae bacterium]NIN95866.1 hypothetical protein [Anaerolineae bacterium]NIQ78833.1 hypothetical protein [Anaerolineae bacterium]
MPTYAAESVFICPCDKDPQPMPGYPFPTSYTVQALNREFSKYYMTLRGDDFPAVVCDRHTDLRENTQEWLVYRLNGSIDVISMRDIVSERLANSLEM